MIKEIINKYVDSSPPVLTTLINMQRLRALTHQDAEVLNTLLTMTLNSNNNDLFDAGEFYTQQEWSEMAKCIHRISGAAQITGASDAEKACRKAEVACLSSTIEVAEITDIWLAAKEVVEELNSSISQWLQSNSKH